MRRVACAVVLLVLGAPAGAAAFETRERDAPWYLAGVSRDGMTLRLVYEGGGCLDDDGRSVVAEERDRVVVRVRQTTYVPGEGEGCTADLAFLPLRVRLAAPVAGRRIVGGPRFAAGFPSPRVPRVVGLHRRDAVALLRATGARVELVGRARATTVVRQSPRAGARRSGDGRLAVVLTLG